MLHQLDESLEVFLRARVPLPAQAVDVAFEPPDREWGTRITRPTVNLFLWDICRAAHRASSGMETVTVNGETKRRRPPPVVEFRYLVTAWTTEHSDEHQLLGSVLRTVLANRVLPAELLVGELTRHRPPTMELAHAGTRSQTELWSALDGQLKPGLQLLVSMAIDVDDLVDAGPPVAALDFALHDRESGAVAANRRVAGEVADPAAVGAVVRSPLQETTVNPAGRFVIRARAGDEIVVETDPPQAVVVPDEGGVRFG